MFSEAVVTLTFVRVLVFPDQLRFNKFNHIKPVRTVMVDSSLSSHRQEQDDSVCLVDVPSANHSLQTFALLQTGQTCRTSRRPRNDHTQARKTRRTRTQKLRSSPVVVKMPTSRLILLSPSRAMSAGCACVLRWSRRDLTEAQMPMASTSR